MCISVIIDGADIDGIIGEMFSCKISFESKNKISKCMFIHRRCSGKIAMLICSKWLICLPLFVALIIFSSKVSWCLNKQELSVYIDQKRLEYAKEAIRKFGDKIPLKVQKNILEQKVTLGMTPYEAKLSAGGYYFKVDADPMYWTKDSDPFVVMDAQSVRADKSKIWMTFETSTQYPGEGTQSFTVYFFNGKAECIIKNTQNIK